MPSNSLPKVLVDADVMSHFFAGESASLLNMVFPGRLAIVKEVEDELRVLRRFNHLLDNFVKLCQVELVSFPDDDGLTLEYVTLRRVFGKGESACMALARHRGNYIASSNLRDIKAYCQQHRITYYTTFDILHLAVKGRHLSVPDCNAFITKVKASGSKMPFTTYEEYLKAGPRL
jgi:predicted nucleic acid-binding protein